MDVGYIPFAFPGLSTVRCAFQTRAAATGARQGNISFETGDDPEAVLASRLSLRRRLGFDAWHELRQVHGARMIFDPEPGDIHQPGRIEADGQATCAPSLALVIKTADCQPILLAHRSGRYVAALHAGWRGNRCDFPGQGVRTFCERYALNPGDVFAVRGPSLGPAASEFVNFSQEWTSNFLPWFDAAQQTMHLWNLTQAQLLDAGLPPENLYSLDLCTWSLSELFFSYRKDRRCGRQASCIWIEPA